LIHQLFFSFADELELKRKYQLPTFVGNNPVSDINVISGIIESVGLSHQFYSHLKVIQRPNLPPNVQIQLPPGANVPLTDGFSRAYDFSVLEIGWIQATQTEEVQNANL